VSHLAGAAADPVLPDRAVSTMGVLLSRPAPAHSAAARRRLAGLSVRLALRTILLSGDLVAERGRGQIPIVKANRAASVWVPAGTRRTARRNAVAASAHRARPG